MFSFLSCLVSTLLYYCEHDALLFLSHKFERFICFCVGSSRCHDISIRAIRPQPCSLICEIWLNSGTGNLVLKAALCFLSCNLSAETPASGLTHAAHVSSVSQTSAHSPFLNLLLSVVSRSTPRGTFCWQPWRSTTRWEAMKSQPRWARLTTPPPWCSTTRGSSTGSRVGSATHAASAWTGTHISRRPVCGDDPRSSKSKSQTWPMWTPSTDGHG